MGITTEHVRNVFQECKGWLLNGQEWSGMFSGMFGNVRTISRMWLHEYYHRVCQECFSGMWGVGHLCLTRLLPIMVLWWGAGLSININMKPPLVTTLGVTPSSNPTPSTNPFIFLLLLYSLSCNHHHMPNLGILQYDTIPHIVYLYLWSSFVIINGPLLNGEPQRVMKFNISCSLLTRKIAKQRPRYYAISCCFAKPLPLPPPPPPPHTSPLIYTSLGSLQIVPHYTCHHP